MAQPPSNLDPCSSSYANPLNNQPAHLIKVSDGL